MARKDSAPLLAKYFVIRTIDVERTLGGQELCDGYGGKDSGLPWFLFLDRDGKTLATSGSGDQNLGCPYKPEEIVTFGALLHKAAPGLAQEDWLALQRSLDAQREEQEKKRP